MIRKAEKKRFIQDCGDSGFCKKSKVQSDISK